MSERERDGKRGGLKGELEGALGSAGGGDGEGMVHLSLSPRERFLNAALVTSASLSCVMDLATNVS